MTSASVYSAGEPQWESNELQQLAAAGKLNGVNPEILALISKWESGYEINGPGINSVGAGGYYGLKVGSTYPGMPTGSAITTADLTTNNVAEFDYQSEVAAAEVKSLLDTYGSLDRALTVYVNGPNGNSYSAEATDISNTFNQLGAPSAIGGNTINAVGAAAPTGSQEATPQGASAAGGVNPGLNLTGPGGIITEILSAIPWTRILLVIIAVILLGIGIDKLFDESKSPAQIISEAPSTTGRQAKGLGQKAGSGARPSQAPFAHAREVAKEGAEDSAEVAA
jgi:hypothetical protein